MWHREPLQSFNLSATIYTGKKYTYAYQRSRSSDAEYKERFLSEQAMERGERICSN